MNIFDANNTFAVIDADATRIDAAIFRLTHRVRHQPQICPAIKPLAIVYASWRWQQPR